MNDDRCRRIKGRIARRKHILRELLILTHDQVFIERVRAERIPQYGGTDI